METKTEIEKKHCYNELKEAPTLKKYLLVGMVGLILLISIFQSFQINTLKKDLRGDAGSNGVDMNTWTEDEKMMYEHHGTIPSRLQQNQEQSNNNMVGGC